MTKFELRERLNTTDEICEDYCLYDLLDCENEDDFETEKFCSLESIQFRIHWLSQLHDRLKGMTFEDLDTQ